tara:strand:+ start:72 stop:224 length:153 start_codon:yes stop_codon:yes gene_type:complete
MEYTSENIDQVAEEIVNNMSLEELKEFVYSEIYGEMMEDEEVFQLNLKKI